MLKQAQQANGEENSLLEAYATRQLEEIDSLEAAYKNSFGAKGQQSGVTRGWSKDSFFGYKYGVLKYKTIDKDGNPIECSELVVGPYRYNYYNYHPNERPQNLIIGCHATITSDAQCPSYNRNTLTDVGMLISHARMNLQTGVNQTWLSSQTIRGMAPHARMLTHISRKTSRLAKCWMVSLLARCGMRCGVKIWKRASRLWPWAIHKVGL